MLLAPIWGLDERVSQLRLRGIPVVLLDRSGNASDFCSVSVDDVEGGRLAAEHLLDQGHTKIALVGGPGISSRFGTGGWAPSSRTHGMTGQHNFWSSQPSILTWTQASELQRR